LGRSVPVRQAIAVAIALGVLTNPVSWFSYDVLLIPIALKLSTSVGWVPRVASGFWILVQATALPLAILGTSEWWPLGFLAARVMIVMGILFSPRWEWLLNGMDESSLRSPATVV
jgi:hypothetical protein